MKSFSLYIYTARPSCELYRQMYFVHSELQDESLHVTISKLPYGSLTCTGGDFPCTGDIQLLSRSKGRCTYQASLLQMTQEKACSITEIFLSNLGPLATEASAYSLSYHAFLGVCSIGSLYDSPPSTQLPVCVSFLCKDQMRREVWYVQPAKLQISLRMCAV